jgi:hypothetical protein
MVGECGQQHQVPVGEGTRFLITDEQHPSNAASDLQRTADNAAHAEDAGHPVIDAGILERVVHHLGLPRHISEAGQALGHLVPNHGRTRHTTGHQASDDDVLAIREPHTAVRSPDDAHGTLQDGAEQRIEVGLLVEVAGGFVEVSRFALALPSRRVEARIRERNADLAAHGGDEF